MEILNFLKWKMNVLIFLFQNERGKVGNKCYRGNVEKDKKKLDEFEEKK